MIKETRKRSLVKSTVWRILGAIELVIEIFFLGTWLQNIFNTAVAVTIVHLISRFIQYYFHERLWARIKWGYE